MMSSTNILRAIIISIFFQSINGLIIGECKEPNEWKTWLNVHRPTAIGEFELVPHYQKIFAGQPFICSKPTGLEVKTINDLEPSTTGDTFRFTFNEDYNRSLPLYINSNGSFTFHYAVWPYICLFTIVALVWLSLYLSTIYARRHLAKHGRYRLSSICQTQDSTMGGEYETSRVLSTINV
ncbi:unnamed protein product [Adineta steineri]|uniref:Uncharacterized protein n=1 Tax=Adineta steineri TaxID=433720 RepID=A0A814VK13_9BILA|nr:unnamed protein product [Adineta steineri]CAF3698581.1 unnamed protein product [Adineta steineri]